ncbi:MAG TPA: ClbS/DfsB family four-helix bundle protein [Candidatus Solibacter sp.]|nr:ClbS/DfsB family four-helix bundle protein [Candidatus Solibacter sp.]
MGKRLGRQALLQEINTEREALNALLKQIKPREMTVAGVTPGGWSVKDILAHVLGWQERLLKWHEAEQRGETPAVPAPGMTWADLKRFNEMIYQEQRRRSLQAVIRDYEVFHQRMIDLIEATSDRDLVTVGRFKWMGPTWTLSDYCRAETASHYRWARKWIGRWKRAREKTRLRRDGI